MLISLRVAVQDCQAVPFDDGNGTLAEKEVFEKFYNCYFGKYFADSDSVQKYVNQRVEYSMDSQEKVESTGCPKNALSVFPQHIDVWSMICFNLSPFNTT